MPQTHFLRNCLLFTGALLTLCCLAILLINFPGPQQIGLSSNKPAGSAPEPSGSGQPGVPPPKRGNCENVGQDYANNPFLGWPVLFFEGDWKTVSAWWCDPLYVLDFGADHWGIDIAALVNVTVSQGGTDAIYTSIATAEVVCTLSEGMYGYAISAREDGGWNFGMGNHVKIMALTCEETCGEKPPASELDPGEVVFVLEEDAADCGGQAGTPAPGATLEPPGDPDDLLLACLETGWVATYMHLKTVAVEPEQLVERGDVLGTVDSTGNSTGAHLHYQINGPGVGAIDPAPAMCGAYTNELRVTPRWLREACGGSNEPLEPSSAAPEGSTP